VIRRPPRLRRTAIFAIVRHYAQDQSRPAGEPLALWPRARSALGANGDTGGKQLDLSCPKTRDRLTGPRKPPRARDDRRICCRRSTLPSARPACPRMGGANVAATDVPPFYTPRPLAARLVPTPEYSPSRRADRRGNPLVIPLIGQEPLGLKAKPAGRILDLFVSRIRSLLGLEARTKDRSLPGREHRLLSSKPPPQRRGLMQLFST